MVSLSQHQLKEACQRIPYLEHTIGQNQSQQLQPHDSQQIRRNDNPQNNKRLLSELDNEDKGSIPLFKIMDDETLKILEPDENRYKKFIELLNKKVVVYHTHQIKSEKPYGMVIRGLSSSN